MDYGRRIVLVASACDDFWVLDPARTVATQPNTWGRLKVMYR